MLEREKWRLRCHLVPPCIILTCIEGEFEKIITKIRLSIKDNND